MIMEERKKGRMEREREREKDGETMKKAKS